MAVNSAYPYRFPLDEKVKETEGYRQCLAGGKAVQFRQDVEVNGVARHFLLCLIPVLANPDDALPRIWGLAREVTDLVAARAHMASLNQVLEDRVSERTATLNAANLALERLSNTDYLTGISNRRHFMTMAATEIARARRYHTELALILIDLDKFKSINDQHGHAAGDLMLLRFTQTVSTALRTNDIFARLGGDEFAVLVPQAGSGEVAALAVRIKTMLATITAPKHAGRLHLEATLGVAYLVPDDRDIDGVMKRADDQLYLFKSGDGDFFAAG